MPLTAHIVEILSQPFHNMLLSSVTTRIKPFVKMLLLAVEISLFLQQEQYFGLSRQVKSVNLQL